MNEVYITADHHFFHKNILNFQQESRPFDSIEEMHETLIDNHNAVVKKCDDVYMLGDFSFASVDKTLEILKRLKGRKHFIFGNHDHNFRKKSVFKEHFIWMKEYAEIKVDNERAVLFHYPIHHWNRMHYGFYHFYGHTHGQVPHLYHGRSMDVGVDTNECKPYNIREIFEWFESLKTNSNDEYDKEYGEGC